MMADIEIAQVVDLPDDFDLELVDAAEREGFAPIAWLKDQWREGTNQFSGPGEGLFVARTQGRLVALCGLNKDPFDGSGSMGRLRRLYVLPELRRMGIGRMLVEEVLRKAHDHFDGVNLRTLDENSAAFFEHLGFSRTEGVKAVTHRKLNI